MAQVSHSAPPRVAVFLRMLWVNSCVGCMMHPSVASSICQRIRMHALLHHRDEPWCVLTQVQAHLFVRDVLCSSCQPVAAVASTGSLVCVGCFVQQLPATCGSSACRSNRLCSNRLGVGCILHTHVAEPHAASKAHICKLLSTLPAALYRMVCWCTSGRLCVPAVVAAVRCGC